MASQAPVGAYGMKRKSIVIACGIGTALLATGLTVGVLVRHEPSFFRAAQVAPGPDRKKHSMEFINGCAQLGTRIQYDVQWYGQFTAEQVNSYLAENFVTEGTEEKLLPRGVHEPRVTFGPGTVRLAFRYGEPPLSTIVSVDLRVWLVRKEFNMVALEVEKVRAGLLPISVHSMLERLTDEIRQQNRGLEFSWYRHGSHPVVLVRFQADRVVPSIRLQQLELRDGEMRVYGRMFECRGE
jgi:hypothetical protein